MKVSEQEIVQKLLEMDEEFQTLHREHQTMEKQLAQFDGKPYLSTEEQVAMKRLKKQKLLGKDKMYAKINEFKRNMAVGP